MINVFNQRASMGSTDALSIIYRDIILFIFCQCVIGCTNNSILDDFDREATKSVQNALEYIYNKYDWGKSF